MVIFPKKTVILFGIVFLTVVAVLMGLSSLLRMMCPFEYREEILAYSHERSLDPFLILAIIQVESNFNREAESRRGARGLMQVMPNTGRWIATQVGINDFHEDMLFEPETNIKMGTWYFASLLKEFKDSTPVALAAYNAGMGNVSNWLKEGRWSGNLDEVEAIPFPETRNYVQKVMAARKRYAILYGRSVQRAEKIMDFQRE